MYISWFNGKRYKFMLIQNTLQQRKITVLFDKKNNSEPTHFTGNYLRVVKRECEQMFMLSKI